MDEMQAVCFRMIASVGGARSLCIEAMQDAKKNLFEEAQKKLQEAEELRQKAHDEHFALLSKESRGESVAVSLLLVHTEDLLVNAEVLYLMASESLAAHRRIAELEQRFS